jgi:RHS repeat-associated protein
VDEGSTAEYRYNALGQRVYKKWTTNSIAGDINGDGLITNADIQLVNGKDGQTIECDGPGKGRGKGQQVACIATQIGNKSDNGKGYSTTSTTALSGRQELLFAYQEHRLIGEYTTIGTAVQETVWLADTPVATIQNNNIYAIHTDHLGTPRVITDSSDFELWRWDSNPFGNTAANEDVDGDRINFTNNLRFPGQYYDVETGKHYNYFRDYDPSTGRYTTSDPIGLDGGLNTYGYVGGNPLKFIDPTGLSNAVVDRANGAITVTMDNGQTITYPAGNNTTNPSGDPNTLGSNGPAPAGTWPVQSPVNTSGDIRYGPYFWPIGAVDAQGNRADISRQRGIGLHGGRSSHQSRTQGCVRMDDADILDLYQRTINDPLTIIEIR